MGDEYKILIQTFCYYIQNCVPDCKKKGILDCQKNMCWQARTFNLRPTSSFWQCKTPFYGNLELSNWLFAIAANTV